LNLPARSLIGSHPARWGLLLLLLLVGVGGGSRRNGVVLPLPARAGRAAPASSRTLRVSDQGLGSPLPSARDQGSGH
jgi:hypothetical protein